MAVITVKPYELQPGDRIMGTPLIVAERAHVKVSVKADGVEYNADAFYGAAGGWEVALTSGGKLTYGGDRDVTVIRQTWANLRTISPRKR